MTKKTPVNEKEIVLMNCEHSANKIYQLGINTEQMLP